MVGGSIYDTVTSRVDIASCMGPHLHFMSTCSMFLDCKTVKFLSFKCRYDAREAQKSLECHLSSLFLEETTAHDPTTDQRTKDCFVV